MDFIVTKASDDNYYDLMYFDTLQELMHYFEVIQCEMILGENLWYDDADAIRRFKPNWADDAEDIALCKYELEIYDSYIE